MAFIGEVFDDDYEEKVLDSKRVVLVDFYADWCVPCHRLSPIVEQLGQEEKRFDVAKIDTDANPESMRSNGIMSLPTLLVVKDGLEVNRIVGAVPKESILAEVEAFL